MTNPLLFWCGIGAGVTAPLLLGLLAVNFRSRYSKRAVVAVAAVIGVAAVILCMTLGNQVAQVVSIVTAFIGATFAIFRNATIINAATHSDGTTQPAQTFTPPQKDGFEMGAWLLVCVGFVVQIALIAA